ncbi:hypothetical protein RN001_003751 [Aquatica leii]|uniref:CCHC-type domain-containing protein n=1 Tax=Aquatica leii TaxID=1421715 RepID=A0AAN7QBX2_9COLE|nr:hypothetical protein RN001_003751 [Aquatica leii]
MQQANSTGTAPDMARSREGNDSNPTNVQPFITLGMIANTLESFSGRQDVRDYFEKLEHRASLDGWSDEITLKLVKFRLTGEAYQFYKSDAAVYNETNYSIFKKKMYGKFLPARIPGQALLRLSKCYQRHDESIANYVIRLKSLGNEILAEDLQNAVQENIPGLKQKCEELVLNQFRIGIKKESMKQLTPLLMRTENLNLETAEKFAKQFELSELMINSRNQSSVVMAVQERKCFYCGKNNHFSQNCRFRIDERNKRNYSNQHHNFQNVRQETPKQQHYRYENYKTNYNHHQQHPSRFHVNNFQKHNFRYNNKSFHNDNVPRDNSFLRRNNTYKEEVRDQQRQTNPRNTAHQYRIYPENAKNYTNNPDHIQPIRKLNVNPVEALSIKGLSLKPRETSPVEL